MTVDDFKVGDVILGLERLRTSTRWRELEVTCVDWKGNGLVTYWARPYGGQGAFDPQALRNPKRFGFVVAIKRRISLDDALDLVGIDGVTEARNGCPQPLNDGSTLTTNRDGTFTVTSGRDPRCVGCEALNECERGSIHPECR